MWCGTVYRSWRTRSQWRLLRVSALSSRTQFVASAHACQPSYASGSAPRALIRPLSAWAPLRHGVTSCTGGGTSITSKPAAAPIVAPATATATATAATGAVSAGIRVRNNLTRQTEALALPVGGAALKWYMCGPTPIVLAMGMTDVDDKIIARANERKQSVRELAGHFERDFLSDMNTLGVRPPSAIMRVSDHIPEVIAFIEAIVKNGYAYVDAPTASASSAASAASASNVFFDVQRFGGRFKYGALRPTAVSAAATTAVTSGASDPELTAADALLGVKRNPLDFALWKRSKPGEPTEAQWSSPWGNGRPGWHIECSAVSSAMFGSKFDIHSGGIDLLFPHHNNEIAQCQAHFLDAEWCRYFWHTGHLHIAGHKMSKSLKNFITVKEFLRSNTPDQWRMFCLRSKYHSNIEFSADRMADAAKALRSYDEFFSAVRKSVSSGSNEKRWSTREAALHSTLLETQIAVRTALSDDFDTTTALQALARLCSRTHTYLSASETAAGHAGVSELLRSVSDFVSRMLSVFGFPTASGLTLYPTATHTLRISGHTHAASSSDSNALLSSSATPVVPGSEHSHDNGDGNGNGNDNVDRTDRWKPVMDEFVRFRQSVRSQALGQLKTGTPSPAAEQVLQMCDQTRDRVFPALGVLLSDSRGGTSQWRELRSGEQLPTSAISNPTNSSQTHTNTNTNTSDNTGAVDPATDPTAALLAADEAATRAKLRFKLDLGLRLRDVPADRLFIEESAFHPTPLYSQFDAAGVPTHDAAGEPLSKTAVKRLRQKQLQHKKKLEARQQTPSK